MNIIFFQNCLSPHQIPYIKALPSLEGVQDVIVVVPFIDYETRKEMGWSATELLKTPGLQFLVKPSLEEVKYLYDKYQNTDTWCMYSGINAFADVIPWFRLSLKYNIKRGVITEPPLLYNHPLWQHALRFAIKDWRYVKYIDKFFVMGDDFLGYYKTWSKRWDVLPFMYCTEWRDRNNIKYTEGNLRVLYVGSLSHRKNVQCLLSAVRMMSENRQKRVEVGIVGDGDQRKELERLANDENTFSDIKFYGNQPMSDIPGIMERYDVLVLPSRHDGWGAVVNEALTLGLYVICSNHCGAKYLLKNKEIGLVYPSGNTYDLMSALISCENDKEIIRNTIQRRIEWSKMNISGTAIAEYFLNNLK